MKYVFKNVQAGFTLIELMLSMSIFTLLVGISTISLSNIERTSSLTAEVNKMIPDIKEQQIKAMSGDTEGSGSAANYGVHFDTSSYTLFKDTYVAGNTNNFVVNLASNIQVTGSDIIFLRGSGEISGGAKTVIFTDTTTGRAQTVTINKYGVITGVN